MITVYYTTTPDFFGTSESRAFFDLDEAKEWGEESTLEDIGDWTGDESFSYTVEVVKIPVSELGNIKGYDPEELKDDWEGDKTEYLESLLQFPEDVLSKVDDWSEYVTEALDIEVGGGANFNVSNLVSEVQDVVAKKLDIKKRHGELADFWSGYMQLPEFQIRIKDHKANPARLGINDLSFVISGNDMGSFSGGDVEIYEPSESAEDIAASILSHVTSKINELLQCGCVDEFDMEQLNEIKERL